MAGNTGSAARPQHRWQDNEKRALIQWLKIDTNYNALNAAATRYEAATRAVAYLKSEDSFILTHQFAGTEESVLHELKLMKRRFADYCRRSTLPTSDRDLSTRAREAFELSKFMPLPHTRTQTAAAAAAPARAPAATPAPAHAAHAAHLSMNEHAVAALHRQAQPGSVPLLGFQAGNDY
ncbi:hypothetical protein BC828DRAFT_155325 [Blastocladiella britannica]|nr:hypothetical protein BC828DRAFT_155325 [Blastocladiella britannica]